MNNVADFVSDAGRLSLARLTGALAARPGGGSLVVAMGAFVLACGGCAHIKRDPPPPPDPAGTYVTLTRPIIAAGDTQEHETTGFPLIDNDGAVDAYVEVAQRPPEQPLFGRRLSEWVLVNHPAVPVLHMGDVLDMSCRSELERIWALGKAATQPIAILPGNHDGLMFGIFNLPVFGEIAEKTGHAWYRGCLRGAEEGATDKRRSGLGSTVDRRTFISTYLTSVATIPEPAPGLAPVPETGRVRISWRNPRPDPYIEAIEVNLQDGDAYANSFLAQKLRLPAADGAPRGVVIIGLDTNQVGVAVGTLDTIRSLSPGDIGHVRADQLAAIKHWIEDAQRSGDIVVFAGHHNWNRLSFASQARVAALFEGIDHPLVYLSAHTHQGFWAMHWVGERPLLELNVSSLSDWPIAYRRISFAFDAQANRLKVVADLMPDSGVPVDSDQALLESWEAVTCRPTGIASMRIEEEELQVVQQQRAARGSLFDWMYQSLGEWCPSCQRNLYASGIRYQGAVLRAIEQMYVDLLPEVPAVRVMRPSASCGATTVPECLVKLRVETPDDLDQAMALFRQRAQFIDAMNQQFDQLQGPLVRNYMVCRAVIGAKIDFDLTPKDRRPGQDEASRRARDFFRTEATVGFR
jgi:hypothetical protein